MTHRHSVFPPNVILLIRFSLVFSCLHQCKKLHRHTHTSDSSCITWPITHVVMLGFDRRLQTSGIWEHEPQFSPCDTVRQLSLLTAKLAGPQNKPPAPDTEYTVPRSTWCLWEVCMWPGGPNNSCKQADSGGFETVCELMACTDSPQVETLSVPNEPADYWCYKSPQPTTRWSL